MKRYPEYKESGVEWIGEMPRHWEVLKAKHVGSSNPPKNNPKTARLKDEPVVFLPMERVHTDGTIDQELRLPYSQLKNGYTYFEEGDILIAKVTPCFENGKIVHINDLATSVGFGSTEFIVIRPDLQRIFPPFLYYIFRSDPLRSIGKHFMTSAIGLKRVPTEFVENFQIPIPVYQEQTQIANFLDRKTEQIDELIRIKERRIELLQEQRTALINQAVTKGLDPNMEMKPSGVEWIGEIPAHWEVRRNRRIFHERDDRSRTGEEELLTVSHITGVSPRAEKKNVGMFLAETMEGYKHCSVGDLVINTMWAWMGALGVSSFDGIVSPSYNVYQLKSSEYVPKYYDYLYRTPNHIKEIIRWSKGIWHSRWRLYPDAFFSIFTITPPFREQAKIVDFLNCKNKQIDELIVAEQRKIELLKEYRQSLISEAVTGKIDVRGEV